MLFFVLAGGPDSVNSLAELDNIFEITEDVRDEFKWALPS